MELQKLIHSISEELRVATIHKQRRRYLEGHLTELLQYQTNHPESDEVPNSLQLYCDLNPDALECRVYDD